MGIIIYNRVLFDYSRDGIMWCTDNVVTWCGVELSKLFSTKIHPGVEQVSIALLNVKQPLIL